MLYGRFATSFVASGASEARSSCSASPKWSSTLAPESRRYGSSDVSSSTATTRATRCGEELRQHADAGADLEHDVVRRELGEAADHAEDVLVHEEVLAERLLRTGDHSQTEALGRVAVDLPLELLRILVARLRERRERVHDVGGLVRPAAHRLRGEVRARRSRRGSGRQAPRARPAAGRPPSGSVALPANETYQPRSSAGSSRCGDEKQCKTTRPSNPSSAASVSASAARVWITAGLPVSAATSSIAANRRSCLSRGA